MVDDKSLGVITNLGAGVGIFIAVLLIYDALRYFFPGLVLYREQAARNPEYDRHDDTPLVALPRPSPYPLSWVASTLKYPEHKLIETHGLDVALYVRFLATQVKVFALLTVFTAIVLYPTYITADKRDIFAQDDPLRPAGIEVVSLSNVPDKSNLLWVTLLSEIVVVLIILSFLYRDIRAYTRYRRIYRSDPRNPSNYSITILDIPEKSRSEHHIYETFDKIFPGQVKHVHIVRDAESLLKLKEKYVKALTKRERAQFGATGEMSSDSLQTRSSSGKHFAKHFPNDDKILLYQKEEQDIRAEVEEHETAIDHTAPITSAAIVVFRSKRAATFAATAPVCTTQLWWSISRAPEPRAVNWNRLDISGYTKRIRQYISFACLTGLAILWTFPAGFIQALGNFDEFAKKWPDSFISSFKENNPDFASFLEGVLPPLLLFLVLLIIPVIVRFVVSFERIHSLVQVEAKVRNYLYFFYFMSNFVYVVVIGSVFSKFKAILDDPTELVSLLSTSVPAQATFLMKYVLINAFLGSTVGMLNVGRLLFRPIMMLRAKTPREIQKADRIFAHYPFAKTYALCAMVALISYVYCTIAPVICAVALLYFSIAYLCTKQLLMYSHRGFFEGGGFLFRDAWTALLIGLYTHQLSMIGIFSLKLATAQAILAILSFIFSIWFTVYCRRTFLFRAKHGSLMDQAAADEEAGLQDEIPEHFPDLYTHPGLRSIDYLAKFEERDVVDRDERSEHIAR